MLTTIVKPKSNRLATSRGASRAYKLSIRMAAGYNKVPPFYLSNSLKTSQIYKYIQIFIHRHH